MDHQLKSLHELPEEPKVEFVDRVNRFLTSHEKFLFGRLIMVSGVVIGLALWLMGSPIIAVSCGLEAIAAGFIYNRLK